MSNKEVIRKDDIIQAVVVADSFEDEFVPLTNDLPLSLVTLLNKPILDYTLEFLSLGGVEETFLFCCSHVDLIKEHIRKSIEQSIGWSLNMKVHLLVSESCRSFGDCLRDLDAKGLLRTEFILLEPSVISNIKLLPILKKHREFVKKDKSTAITLVFQEAGTRHVGKYVDESVVIATNDKNRVIFHRKIGKSKEKKVNFPLEIFLENNEVSVFHNLKDTHIAICSSSVLPLFSDNFDFQTRDDFIKGLLMSEEIMEGTVYLHTVKGVQYGDAVVNWQKYHEISWEIKDRWTYPVIPELSRHITTKNNVIGKNNNLAESVEISHCVLGDNIKLGKNIFLKNSFVMSNTKIEDNVNVISSFIGPDCTIKNGSKITDTVLGKNVVVEKKTELANKLVQSKKPEFCEKKDSLGKHCHVVNLDDDETKHKYSSLFQAYEFEVKQDSSDDEQGFSDSDEELSYTQSPVPDDTKLFFTEVIDSLTRGFEDELQCDNLILEINSSRYAYNMSVKEVNYNVIKAILHMYLRQPTGLRQFSQLLSYFSPIMKNYIRNESAMMDCLQAIEDVAITNENMKENWVLFALKWFYNEDHLSEETILKWGKSLDSKMKFINQIKPFLEWLEQAEEASSSEDE